jgi:hypothetical protein
MLSFPVYRERHPRPAVSHPRLTSIPFCFSQPSNLQMRVLHPGCFSGTFQPANALSASRMQLRDDQSSNTLEIFPPETAILSHARPEQRRVSPLAATLMELPASAANKGLTEILTPLDATLTKNRGVGPSLTFQRSNVQQSVSILFTSLLALCALCPKSVSQLYCIQSVPHSFSKKGGIWGDQHQILKVVLEVCTRGPERCRTPAPAFHSPTDHCQLWTVNSFRRHRCYHAEET